MCTPVTGEPLPAEKQNLFTDGCVGEAASVVLMSVRQSLLIISLQSVVLFCRRVSKPVSFKIFKTTFKELGHDLL